MGSLAILIVIFYKKILSLEYCLYLYFKVFCIAFIIFSVSNFLKIDPYKLIISFIFSALPYLNFLVNKLHVPLSVRRCTLHLISRPTTYELSIKKKTTSELCFRVLMGLVLLLQLLVLGLSSTLETGWLRKEANWLCSLFVSSILSSNCFNSNLSSNMKFLLFRLQFDAITRTSLI